MTEQQARRPKAAEVSERLARALPRILGTHAPAHPLEAAFPLPAGGREKALVRCFGLPSPLVLRVYADDERDRLQNAVCTSRALKGEAPAYEVLAYDEAKATAPFHYTLSEMLWGADAESVLASAEVSREDVRQLAVALGGAAAAIHGVRAEGFGEPRLPVDERHLQPSAALLEVLEPAARRAEAAGTLKAGSFATLADLANPLFEVLDDDAREQHEGTLVHGRLDLSSLIVKQTEGRYRLVGLVGLGSARLLDAAYDLAWLEARVFPRYPALKDPFYLAYSARRPLTAAVEERTSLYRAILSLIA